MPDMFQIKEPANAPPEWHREPGETIPGMSDKPCPPPGTSIKDIVAEAHKFMSPHPLAPKGETQAYTVNGGKC